MWRQPFQVTKFDDIFSWFESFFWQLSASMLSQSQLRISNFKVSLYCFSKALLTANIVWDLGGKLYREKWCFKLYVFRMRHLKRPNKYKVNIAFSVGRSIPKLLLRPYWRCYYANTDGLVYVIDSSDKDRLGTARAELSAMLQVNNYFGNFYESADSFRRRRNSKALVS